MKFLQFLHKGVCFGCFAIGISDECGKLIQELVCEGECAFRVRLGVQSEVDKSSQEEVLLWGHSCLQKSANWEDKASMLLMVVAQTNIIFSSQFRSFVDVSITCYSFTLGSILAFA